MLSEKQLQDAAICGDKECKDCSLFNKCQDDVNEIDHDLVMSEIAQNAIAYRDMLKRLEWVNKADGTQYCHICKHKKIDGHEPDCELATLLREGNQ